jgi:general secretion pathway protein H
VAIDHARAVRGFTLLELVVVVLIMGLLAGLVSVVSRPDERAMLHIEAERLGRLLDLAAEESRYSGKTIAWSADARGYRFWRFLEPGWTEILDNDLLRARALPPGMTLSGIWAENMGPQETMRLELVPYRTFAYSIEMSLGREHYTVTASPIGIVRVAPRE